MRIPCLSRFLLPMLCLIALAFVVPGCGSGAMRLDLSVAFGPDDVVQGATVKYNVQVLSRIVNIDEVSLRVDNLPAKMHASFDHPVLAPGEKKATLTVVVDADAPVGDFTFNVVATETGGSVDSQRISLKVVSSTGAKDFTFSLDKSAITFEDPRDQPNVSINLTPLSHFVGRVDISFGPHPSYLTLPEGLSINIPEGDGGGQGLFDLGINTAAFGQAPITLVVTATSGGISHTQNIVIHFPL